jgi:hypothetical protein
MIAVEACNHDAVAHTVECGVHLVSMLRCVRPWARFASYSSWSMKIMILVAGAGLDRAAYVAWNMAASGSNQVAARFWPLLLG